MKITRFVYPAAALASRGTVAVPDLCVVLGATVACPRGCHHPQVLRAVCVWKETLAIACVGLAASHIEQTRPVRLAVVGLFGLANLAAAVRVIFLGGGWSASPAALSGVA